MKFFVGSVHDSRHSRNTSIDRLWLQFYDDKTKEITELVHYWNLLKRKTATYEEWRIAEGRDLKGNLPHT